MKEVLTALINKLFDFKTLVIILVVLGFLKYEQAIMLLGVMTDTVSKFIGG